MMSVLRIPTYAPNGDKKNSHVICLKIVKRFYSLVAKNATDRNWRLSIKEIRQKSNEGAFYRYNLVTHFIILHIA